MALAPVFVPMGYDDPGRNNKCWPSKPVASARFDRDKLKCFYRCACFCMNLDDLAARTFLDVYESGILVNIPIACCCCCVKDNGRYVWYDNKLFGRDPSPGGCCCQPAPYICTNCLNLCGHTLVFKPGFCGCPDGSFHGANCCCLMCPIDVLCALQDGEGERLTKIMNEYKDKFEANGKTIPKPIVQGAPPQMHVGADVGNLQANML